MIRHILWHFIITLSNCFPFFAGLYHNNQEYGNCKKVTWNEDGNGMFFEDFEFPISIVTNKNETDYLINNVSRVLCHWKFYWMNLKCFGITFVTYAIDDSFI